MVVANEYNGGAYAIFSVVYKFNATANQFQEFQTIPTRSVDEVVHFSMNGASFLAVANKYDGTYNIPSIIYKFNTTSNRFETF